MSDLRDIVKSLSAATGLPLRKADIDKVAKAYAVFAEHAQVLAEDRDLAVTEPAHVYRPRRSK